MLVRIADPQMLDLRIKRLIFGDKDLQNAPSLERVLLYRKAWSIQQAS